MFTEKKTIESKSILWELEDMLDSKHSLYILANKINWERFNCFEKYYTNNFGHPSVPVRRLVGLLILKHLRNESDEEVVIQWRENPYYQYFCGETFFSISAPCTAKELIEFRNRIGIEGAELIFAESVRIVKEEEQLNKNKKGRK